VETAAGGHDALAAVARRPPAVIVLDVKMPDLDGVAVVRRLRAGGVDVPVCILSARDEVQDRVNGLQAGADDYLVKPFALAELTARLQALLRRRGADRTGPILAGDLVIDPRRHGGPEGLLVGSGTFAQVAYGGAVVDRQGDVPSTPPAMPATDGLATVTIDGQPWRARTQTLGDERIEVAQTLTPSASASPPPAGSSLRSESKEARMNNVRRNYT
jgi:CheY-like chemotaxis protein